MFSVSFCVVGGLKMNTHYLLPATLADILQVLNPTQADWDRRFQIIRDLKAVVQTVDILRGKNIMLFKLTSTYVIRLSEYYVFMHIGATVEPFGSFVSNLFTKWGDLDISIELPNGSYISSAGKKHKQTLLLDVLKAMKSFGKLHVFFNFVYKFIS